MTVTRRGILAATALAAPGVAPALGQANRFPDRPVEIVVGFTAGGATDLDARAIAPLLERRLGGTVVVVNRPGAGGEVALASVARSRPDGHTLGTTNMPGLLTIPIERRAQFTRNIAEQILQAGQILCLQAIEERFFLLGQQTGLGGQRLE